MRKLMRYALEGDATDNPPEQEDETPDATDVDPKAAEAADEKTEETQEPSSDSSATETDEPTAEPEASETPEEEDPKDQPPPELELPNDSDFSVDKLADLLQEHDKEVAQKENELGKNNHVATAVSELAKALEHLNVYGGEGLAKVQKDPMVRSAIKSSGVGVSLEGMSVSGAANTIVQTIRTLIKRVLEAIKKAIDWAYEKVRSATSVDRVVAGTIDRALQVMIQNRTKNAKALNAAFGKGEFKTRRYATLGQYALWLTIDGKEISAEPKALQKELQKVYNLIKSQDAFVKCLPEVKIAKVLNDIAVQAQKGVKLDIVSRYFDPTTFVAKGYLEYAHYDGYTADKAKRLFASGPMLGGVTALHEFPRHGSATEALTALNTLAEWKHFLIFKTSEITDGTLRMLGTEEAIGGTQVIKQIAEALEGRRSAYQHFQYLVEELRQVVTTVEATIEDQDMTDPTVLYTQTKVVQAANSIIKNGISALDTSSGYARKVMVAWGYYLAMNNTSDKRVIEEVTA